MYDADIHDPDIYDPDIYDDEVKCLSVGRLGRRVPTVSCGQRRRVRRRPKTDLIYDSFCDS
jgi:hypothetical protein